MAPSCKCFHFKKIIFDYRSATFFLLNDKKGYTSKMVVKWGVGSPVLRKAGKKQFHN